jgi:hypothetical protein
MKTTLNITDNIGGTSWYGLTLIATPNEIIKALEEPHFVDENVGEKVSLEWDYETEDGLVFTIYDWKEYLQPSALHRDSFYKFHIGVKESTDNSRVIEILKEYGLNAQ